MKLGMAHQFGADMANKWGIKSAVLAASKAELCQQLSIEPRWVNDVIDPTTCQFEGFESCFSDIDDADGNCSDLVRA
jgi:hypothetical protein